MSNSEQNTIETAADLAKAAVTFENRGALVEHPEHEATKVLVAIDASGNVMPCNLVMDALDARMPWPRRRKGTTVLTDAESFSAWVKRWTDVNAVIYADTTALRFVVVADENPPSAAGQGWRQFRAQYACPRSPEWNAWTERDGRAMTQTEFGDFLEERLSDLRAVEGFPTPMDVLAVARHLNIRTKGTFQREINPTNGDYILVNKLETTSESTQIPRAFVLAIPVFEGGAAYQIEARIRFVLGEGRAPAFSYTLHRRPEIERDAFNEVRKAIGEATSRLILSGTP